MDSTKKNVLVFLIALLIILGINTSLSYLRAESGSTKNNNITLANFNVNLIDDFDQNIEISMYPMSDTEGLNQNSQTFSIRNNGTILANYKISLQDTENFASTLQTLNKKALPNSDVRYKLIKTYKDANNQVISENSREFEITNLSDTGEIDTGSIGVNCTIEYEIKIWQDYNSEANNTLFSKIIVVEGMQSSNLDKSGANFPELSDNMIPVYYHKISDTEGVWKKADSKNLDESYQWFDYDNQMWANAVTVKETGTKTRGYYLSADIGTEISMDDITTMWVWIPRYKYVIFNGNNETADEQMINVEFEHGIDATGTVRCHDTISGDANSTASEECTDTTNGSIVNHKSTYTHPAFCFGSKKEDGSCDGEELTGFWMAKFEMSTDDATCNETPNATNCNKTGLNILVKPDVYSLRYENVSNMFANIRRMETYGNIHGFSQSSGATTWLNSSGNLTGEINNDSNTIDTHMIKNMEWGAIAYLSQSKFGKQGNNLYTGAYKEVYVNNNNSNKTGYSSGSDKNNISNNSYVYNNLSINVSEQGYLGAGASTTGNVFGVYDTSGGTLEYLMTGNVDDLLIIGSNYKDFYRVSNNNIKGIDYGKFGDATKEIKKICYTSCLGWNMTNNIMLKSKSVMARGGYFFSQADTLSQSGIYYYSVVDGLTHSYITSRPVLTVTRNMPWLNENIQGETPNS